MRSTIPLMMTLERLSPLERAAFLLHDVFGVSSRRSPRRSGAKRPRAASLRAARGPAFVPHARSFQMPKERGLEIAAAFFAASQRRCTSCNRSSPRILPCIPMAAARGQHQGGRLSADI
jgi:hypothetical protein